MSSINTSNNAGIEVAPLLSMITYLKNLRFWAAGIASAMFFSGIILNLWRGPSQAFYLIGPYVALAAIYWALARFGPFATADLDSRDRIRESDDFGRHFLVEQIHAAHMILVAGVCFAASVALMSPFRWVPALCVIMTSICLELALWGRRRQVVVG